MTKPITKPKPDHRYASIFKAIMRFKKRHPEAYRATRMFTLWRKLQDIKTEMVDHKEFSWAEQVRQVERDMDDKYRFNEFITSNNNGSKT